MNLLRLKHLFAGCFLAVSTLPAWGQAAPTLAIRIDDLGAFHSVNEACIQTYQSGIARSVEVMPVAAWYPEAVRLLKENPGLDAGLHLVITSEWENVKWRPLTYCPSLTDENGYFYPMMGANPAYPGQSVMENKWDIKRGGARIPCTDRNGTEEHSPTQSYDRGTCCPPDSRKK